ncbi:MAG: adenosylcobinamide-GDP ribazoletransferase [Thermoanaerobacterales bacterium]|jgi:adenosylcobinamide-GDP ribazoletransferase|nr:adenosylcobinamide-GDP ribazoletransferase [Thermoanaerobacterales bacterium]
MRAALGFLTVVGGAAAPDARARAWFGVVGAVVGLAVGGAWWVAGELWPPLVAAVVAVAVDAALTGLLHLDGLADAADGLLPPLPRDRRLAVMAAPDVGAFGVAALVLVLGARVAALAALRPDVALVVGLWAGSRAAMALTMALVPYARERGVASGFTGRPSPAPAVTLVAAVAVVVLARGGGAGVATAAGLLVGFAAVVGLARRRLGGYTGDVLGAAGVVAETVGLLVAAARW